MKSFGLLFTLFTELKKGTRLSDIQHLQYWPKSIIQFRAEINKVVKGRLLLMICLDEFNTSRNDGNNSLPGSLQGRCEMPTGLGHLDASLDNLFGVTASAAMSNYTSAAFASSHPRLTLGSLVSCHPLWNKLQRL